MLRRKLEYVKILQAKYFTGENIPIYGTMYECMYYKSKYNFIIMKINMYTHVQTCIQYVNPSLTINSQGVDDQE